MSQRVRMVNPKLPGQAIWTSKPRARLRAGWVEEPEPEPEPTPETREDTEPREEIAGLSREPKRRRRRAEQEGDE